MEKIVLGMLRKELMLRGDGVRKKERVILFQQVGVIGKVEKDAGKFSVLEKECREMAKFVKI